MLFGFVVFVCGETKEERCDVRRCDVRRCDVRRCDVRRCDVRLDLCDAKTLLTVRVPVPAQVLVLYPTHFDNSNVVLLEDIDLRIGPDAEEAEEFKVFSNPLVPPVVFDSLDLVDYRAEEDKGTADDSGD